MQFAQKNLLRLCSWDTPKILFKNALEYSKIAIFNKKKRNKLEEICSTVEKRVAGISSPFLLQSESDTWKSLFFTHDLLIWAFVMSHFSCVFLSKLFFFLRELKDLFPYLQSFLLLMSSHLWVLLTRPENFAVFVSLRTHS